MDAGLHGPDRELSFWGWGHADRFPADDERRKLADLVGSLLGVERLPLRAPPRLEDARAPPARLSPPPELAAFTTSQRETRIRHTYGRSYRDLARAFQGDFGPAPDLVATPRAEEDVVAVLAWASAHRVAVIPYGGGTSVVGGIEPEVGPGFRGTLSLDLRGMDRVLEVEPVSLAARIQAGATGPRIEEQLAPHGLTLRHYPQSYEHSTLGGWIATRAGGHFATLTTRIDDFVESVRLVTPTGAMETRRLPSSGAGPDPNRFVLGSEGALGVITEAWMRVQRRPSHRARATVSFDSFDAAVAAARDVAQARLYPANCRVLDGPEALLNGLGLDGRSLLLLGFESTDSPQGALLDRAIALARANGGTVDARDDGVLDRAGAEGRWRRSFLDAPYLFNVLVSLGVLVDTFETAVTWDRFPALDSAIRAAVTGALDRACAGGYLSCRLTHVYPDGPAPYYTFLGVAEAGREEAQWLEVKRAASDALAASGATITHHHAVGRTHRPWYEREVPARYLAALRGAKRELDPAGVMNPGVLLPPDGSG